MKRRRNEAGRRTNGGEEVGEEKRRRDEAKWEDSSKDLSLQYFIVRSQKNAGKEAVSL